MKSQRESQWKERNRSPGYLCSIFKKMNRTNYNYMRPDREMKGLQQVSQMSQATNPLNPIRKSTFTRTEFLQRGQSS